MKAKEVVKIMMQQDYFSQWLGIKVIAVKTDYCKLEMKVRKEMLNGFGIAHGGITFSLADSALAFASNSGGTKSLSIETSISHLISLNEDESIIAEAICTSQSKKLGHYSVTVYLKRQPVKKVALFKGVVYKTSESWN